MSEEFLEKQPQAERFVRDPIAPTVNTVYLRVKSEQVKGLLGSKYAVPQGFMGLSKDLQGKSKLLFPGEEATGDFTLHLVRDRDIRVPFSVLKAKSKDGFDSSVSFELAVTPDVSHKDSLEAFIERGAQKRKHLDWPLLKGELQPTITGAILDAVKGKPAAELSAPDAFERLAQRLLRESGFTKVEVTGKSGDGGIDGVGILRMNLVSFQVSFQCKRWKGSVGSSTVRDFRGAMVGRADKGLIITTGNFTADARREATRDGAPAIDLIDGETLCELLKERRLGVSVRMVEEIELDSSFFSSI